MIVLKLGNRNFLKIFSEFSKKVKISTKNSNFFIFFDYSHFFLKIFSTLVIPPTNRSIYRRRDNLIRFSLFKQSMIDNNEPENYFVIYETFCVLLSLYRAKELAFSIPFLFKLEVIKSNK